MSLLLLLLVVGIAHVTWSAATCSVSGDDYCRCSTSNGLTLDLRHIGISYPEAVEAGDYAYIYTPCTLSVCAKSTGVMCQDALDNDFEYILGKYTSFSWEVTNEDPGNLEFQLHYGGGDGERQAVVNFVKGAGETKFSYDRQESLIYYFGVTGSGITPYSSGSRSSGNSSGGDVSGPIGISLIFLALGGLVAYFVVGGIFMYTKRGARGVAVIPNYAFWKDLPFLLKDGFFFTISPCYRRRDGYSGLKT